MAIIEHDLLPKQKVRKSSLRVKVGLYVYAGELYDELSRIAIIDRIQKIPQLGVIRVSIKLKKSRFDFMVLQLYFHQLIKEKLQNKLKLTYNNAVRASEFREDMTYLTCNDKPTIGDMLQILTIVYNIGHFYNTFTASRAAVLLATEDKVFKKAILESSLDARFHEATEKLIASHNYQHLHLLNSLLILERCNQGNQSVLLAKELLFSYINRDDLSEGSKLKYVFSLFRSIRNVSYIAYDLQIANTPLTIDLCNKDAILVLFEELLSSYNDRGPAENLINSIQKMLDDTIYNENTNAICYYMISRRMISLMCRNCDIETLDYYNDCFINEDSVLNNNHAQCRDYSNESILKLTFSSEYNSHSLDLLLALERINNSRVGYYDRRTGERTILISIKNHSNNKKATALRITKTVISCLRSIGGISYVDTKFLLTSKFFLFYLFSENPIAIKATIDDENCVFCVRGKTKRLTTIRTLLAQDKGSKDNRYESEYLLKCLSKDSTSDTSIIIPGSIVFYQKDAPGKMLCEFDGMAIHPFRKTEQILLLEAKNTTSSPGYGKRCLCEKLDKLKFEYEIDNVVIEEHNAYLKVTV